MKTTNFLRISGMLLLAMAVSLASMLVVYALQNPTVMVSLGSLLWNG